MLAVGGWSQGHPVLSGVFSHASAKISMGKVGSTPHMRARQAPHMTREREFPGRRRRQPCRQSAAAAPAAAATHDVLPMRSEWDTSKFAGGQQHTRHLSSKPPYPHNASAFCIVTTPPPIKTQHPPSILCSSSSYHHPHPLSPTQASTAPAHATHHSLATDAIGGSTPT